MSDDARKHRQAKLYVILLALTWAYYIYSFIRLQLSDGGGEAFGVSLIFVGPVWLFSTLGAIAYGALLRRPKTAEQYRRFGAVAAIVGILSLVTPFLTFIPIALMAPFGP